MKSLEQLREDLKAMEAELAAKERRIAELEAEDATDVADAEAALAKGEFVPFEDMQPPFEGPI